MRLLDGANRAYEAWKLSIAHARHHIHLLFYEWKNDPTGRDLRDSLIEAVRRGIEVRLLVDAIGSAVSRRFFAPLVHAGGRVEWFLPIRLHSRPATINFRNHRKLIAIDGKEAFVGGMNVGDNYLAWVDPGVHIRGPGVDQVQEVFCDDWPEQGVRRHLRKDTRTVHRNTPRKLQKAAVDHESGRFGAAFA